MGAAPFAARKRLSAAIAGLALLIGCAVTGCTVANADVVASTTPVRPGWVASWGAAMQAAAPPVSAKTYTIRDIVHLSVPGNHVRLWLSNAFGHTPLQLGQVTVAPSDPGDRPTADGTAPQEVTFGGRASVTVPSGEERVSDPVALPVTPGADLLVSLYVTGQPDIATAHVTANSRTYLASTGDDAGDPDGTAFTTQQSAWYFLTGVDVFDPSALGTVVTLGDSLTDGEHSTPDANDRWPDVLAQRILALPPGRQFGVVNAGISGNQIGETTSDGMSAVLREQRDVLDRTGVSTMILFEGINDIQSGAITLSTVDDLERDYRTIAATAHAAHVRILGATITPFGGSPAYTAKAEQVREKINDFIRHSGVFDGVIDLDAALHDPTDPTSLLGTYASADHLHLDDSGYLRVGALIPLDELR